MAERIFLIYPPSRYQNHNSPPLGLLSLGSVLEQAGFEVYLMDANASRNKKNNQQIVQTAELLKPEVIGMTLLTPLIKSAYDLAGKLANSGAKLLAGGPHASILPDETLEYGFDAAVVGEGESTIVEAVKGLMGKIPKDEVKGWVYCDNNGNIKRTPAAPFESDLDNFSFPAWHLIDPCDYRDHELPNIYGNIFSSRGCPMKCAYCSGGLFGKKFRFRSAQSVLNEIAYITDKFNTKHFHFPDDAFSHNRERFMQICEGIIKEKFGITWSMMTRINTMDEEMMSVASKSGCNRVDYGVESGDPDTLKRIHKPQTVEMVRKIIPLTAQYGITPYVFFIFGFPWETVRTINKTFELMSEISPYVGKFHPAIASILVPFPDTEIYEMYHREYDFENWWLHLDMSDAGVSTKTSPYFKSQLFPLGCLLDADFFRYSVDVKRRITEIFKYMYSHNLSGYPSFKKIPRKLLLELSMNLYAINPKLESSVFKPFNKVFNLAKKLK